MILYDLIVFILTHKCSEGVDTKCVACSEGEYSEGGFGKCKPCEEKTISNAAKSACIPCKVCAVGEGFVSEVKEGRF